MYFIQLTILHCYIWLTINSFVCSQTWMPKTDFFTNTTELKSKIANINENIYELNSVNEKQNSFGSFTTSERKVFPIGTIKLKNPYKNTHSLNKKLLKTLGFTKIKAPNSHNRKRLAIESRYKSANDDSHMFIIKLAPNIHYYTNPNAETSQDAYHSYTIQNLLQQHSHKEREKLTAKDSLNSKSIENNEKKVSSFGFSWNGRLNRIYHWNLPVIKKLLNDKKRSYSNLTSSAVKNDLIDIKDVPTWSKLWGNEIVQKPFANTDYKKSLKRKSPSYYAPTNVVNNKSFNKYFAGNGKPKGFYIIKENQKKPFYHKSIIS